MNSLYVHNFRGFDNTILNLQDVNFFLGENSTGKTSILKLIKILSDSTFKVTYDLGSEFSEIGTHYDIVYKGGGNPYFEIGYDKNHSFVKMVLEPRNNRPVIKNLYSYIRGINIEFSFKNSLVEYRYFNVNETYGGFADWIEKINTDVFNADGVEVGSMPHFETWPISTTLLMSINRIFKPATGDIVNTNIYSIILEAFDSALLPKVVWFDPIRAEPRRLYDEYSSAYSSSGGHAPYLLKQILTLKNRKNIFKIREFLKYGNASGLFTEIVPKVFDKNDDSSPFELLIKLGKKTIKMNHVGYGVSQVLPLIVEIMNGEKEAWLAIQQPEVHLHPKAQAAFGDFMFAFAERDKKNFIIETHSDFLVDRFRLALHKFNSNKKRDSIQAQVCFFERSNSGNKISHIPILRDGSYSDKQPDGFRDFFIKEELDLLSL